MHGDDYDVTNNHENYDSGSFAATPICYYHAVSYGDYTVYGYWYYYAFNDWGNRDHEHDFESAFVWVNDSTGDPFYYALSHNWWFSERSVSDTSDLIAFVSRGDHGMVATRANIWRIADNPNGQVIAGDEFQCQPISNLQVYAGSDLTVNDDYKTDESGPTEKAPWLRNYYTDPDGVIRLATGGGHFQKAILHSPGELCVYDSFGNTTGICNGTMSEDIPDSAYYNGSVTVLNQSGSYTQEVAGTENGTYGLEVHNEVNGNESSLLGVNVSTTNSTTHNYSINWNALDQGKKAVTIDIDNNGDGVVDETINTSLPHIPGNASPINGSIDVNISSNLDWTGGDPDAEDTVTYQVYFGTNESPPLASGNQSQISYEPSLKFGTQYYWRVVARDNHGMAVSGPTWNFITRPRYGDADGDNIVNAGDITKVERIILGSDSETTGADANGDGEVNAADIGVIEYMILGIWPWHHVHIEAPDSLPNSDDFTATVFITYVENFGSASLEVTYNSSVLDLEDVTNGQLHEINPGVSADFYTVAIDGWSQPGGPGTLLVNASVDGNPGPDGAGYLAQLHFHVIGSAGQTSPIAFNVPQSWVKDNVGGAITATWEDDSVTVVP